MTWYARNLPIGREIATVRSQYVSQQQIHSAMWVICLLFPLMFWKKEAGLGSLDTNNTFQPFAVLAEQAESRFPTNHQPICREQSGALKAPRFIVCRKQSTYAC